MQHMAFEEEALFPALELRAACATGFSVVGYIPPPAAEGQPAHEVPLIGRPGELAPARSGNGLTVVTVAGIAGAVLLVALLLILLF